MSAEHHISRRCFLSMFASSFAIPLVGWDRQPEDAILLVVERSACAYFYEQTDPETGLVKDRARHTGPDDHTISSIAATGFGLSAICIAHANQFVKPADAVQRVQRTLEFLARRMPHEHGFFYHFVDMRTAERAFKS